MNNYNIKIEKEEVNYSIGLPIDDYVSVLNKVNGLNISEEDKSKIMFNHSLIIIKGDIEKAAIETNSDKKVLLDNANCYFVGKGEYLDITVGKTILGIGIKQDLTTLLSKDKKEIENNKKELIPQAGSYQTDTIEYEAMNWLENGEQGLSSLALCYNLCGDEIKEKLSTNKNSDFKDYPRDADDLSRCIKFFNMVPKAKSKLIDMKSVSKEWFNLTDKWEELEENFKSMQKSSNKEIKNNYATNIYNIINNSTRQNKAKP